MKKNYYQHTTSPSSVVFDRSGQGIQRSYIGPQNYITNTQLEKYLTPKCLEKELKHLRQNRKLEDKYTQLKGRHALSSVINNPRLVKINKSKAGSFQMSGTSMSKKTSKNNQIVSGTAKEVTLSKNNGNEILVEEIGNPRLSNNIMRRRKRNCGCSSVIQISTPKHSAFSNRAAPLTCKEQVFQDTLKQTRYQRNRDSLKTMSNFWEKFKKKCKHSIKLKKPRSLLQVSDEYPQKNFEKSNGCTDTQLAINNWHFSLRKSTDRSRKHFEMCKGSTDPNRALWVHVNELRPQSRAHLKLKRSIKALTERD